MYTLCCYHWKYEAIVWCTWQLFITLSSDHVWVPLLGISHVTEIPVPAQTCQSTKQTFNSTFLCSPPDSSSLFFCQTVVDVWRGRQAELSLRLHKFSQELLLLEFCFLCYKRMLKDISRLSHYSNSNPPINGESTDHQTHGCLPGKSMPLAFCNHSRLKTRFYYVAEIQKLWTECGKVCIINVVVLCFWNFHRWTSIFLSAYSLLSLLPSNRCRENSFCYCSFYCCDVIFSYHFYNFLVVRLD